MTPEKPGVEIVPPIVVIPNLFLVWRVQAVSTILLH